MPVLALLYVKMLEILYLEMCHSTSIIECLRCVLVAVLVTVNLKMCHIASIIEY